MKLKESGRRKKLRKLVSKCTQWLIHPIMEVKKVMVITRHTKPNLKTLLIKIGSYGTMRKARRPQV
jgi:hypothetical protein